MEARVLMPAELCLTWLGNGLCVCARTRLERGARFSPEQGAVRLGLLPPHEQPSNIHQLQRFGSYDEIIRETGGRAVRRCNWVRFLKAAGAVSANLKAALGSDGKPQFETLRPISPYSPLLTSFPSFTGDVSECNSLVAAVLQDGPLDLSQKLLSESCELPVASSTNPRSRDQVVSVRVRGQQRALLPCEVCGKAFDRPSLLKRHMRTHTGERPHACSVCEKRFSTSSSLNTHRRIHSGEKPHQCGVCGKRFTASSNLYYHRMTHTKDKPHKCSLCLKSFPTPGDLRSHQYVHSGDWPFRCGACGRGFSKQTNLRNHLFLHTGDKPHSCSVCGKKFALACNLRAHAKTHEEDPHQEATSICSTPPSPPTTNITFKNKDNKKVSPFSPWDFYSENQQAASVEMAKVAALWSSSMLPGVTMEGLQRGLILEAHMLLGSLQQQQTSIPGIGLSP